MIERDPIDDRKGGRLARPPLGRPVPVRHRGRLEPGGDGNHGTDPANRFRILRERIEACKAIWTEEEASYHGEFVDFDRIVCRPAPLQQPHPPILVGGHGPRVHERVVAYGDAWFPNRIPPDEQMITRVEELQRLGEEAGRGQIPVTLQIPPRDPAVLERYERAGVTRAVHMLRAGDAADAGSAERKLDEWVERIQSYSAARGRRCAEPPQVGRSPPAEAACRFRR